MPVQVRKVWDDCSEDEEDISSSMSGKLINDNFTKVLSKSQKKKLKKNAKRNQQQQADLGKLRSRAGPLNFAY